MDFSGLLRFSLMCLDFLAWPAFALGYPIWASIRAIETGSKYHMKKLVTYWTVLSLISLFEHAFRLNQWVPYWPYIKLVAICWLIIPRFNRACHVYQSIVHPCSPVSLQAVINWFCCPEEKKSVNDTFLTSLETYLQENGSEALEKLIASKRSCKEHHVADAQYLMEKVELTEKNVVSEEPRLNVSDTGEAKEREEMIEKNAAAERQRLKRPQTNFAKTQTAAAEVPTMSMPEFTEEKKNLEAAAGKKTQNEWTCAVCQVTATSEADLNSHLKGKKHKSKSEELKNGKQSPKNVQPPPTTRASDSDHAKKKPQNCVSREKPKQIPTAKPENARNTATSGKHMQKKQNSAGVVIQHSTLLCDICNVRCSGEIAMEAHLKGRKHLDNIQSRVNSVTAHKPEIVSINGWQSAGNHSPYMYWPGTC